MFREDNYISNPRDLLKEYILYCYNITRDIDMVVNHLNDYITTNNLKYITTDNNFRRRFYYSIKPGAAKEVIGEDLEGYIRNFLKEEIGLEDKKNKKS